MERLEEGERYVAYDNSIGAHGDMNGPEVVPYSWLHMNDNVMDPFHVQVLHSSFSVTHFVREFAVMPTVRFEEIGNGVIYRADRDLPDGRHVERISTWIMPNVMSVPSTTLDEGHSTMLGFAVPVDDGSCRVLITMRVGPAVRQMGEGTGLADLKP